MNTFEKVRELLASQLNLGLDKISLDSDIIGDLGADSIDLFEMLMHMDEEFNISLPEEKAKNIKTVGDLVKFIDELK
ncbi:MAG: acyl carrier protein [Clostridia bacterium]